VSLDAQKRIKKLGFEACLRDPNYRGDQNLALYLPRLAGFVSIEADRPGAWFPDPLGPYAGCFPASTLVGTSNG
jgi:hypothetical protein